MIAKTLSIACALLLASGCQDPVRDRQSTDLGPESPSVPPGPLHRSGQRCAGPCHDGVGPGGWVFSLAGTVYEHADDAQPLAAAKIRFVDSAKSTYVTETNCAGNFFVQQADFAPVFPVWVAVEQDGITTAMASPIQREASCAGCHSRPAGRASAGPVYFADPGFAVTKASCPQ